MTDGQHAAIPPDDYVVVDIDPEPKRYDLKSVRGGWVEIREMSHGENLARQDMIMEMSVKMAEQGRKGPDTMDLKTKNEATSAYDFKKCIVRHNLRHKDGRPYQFANPLDWSGKLNPRVGGEIESIIRKVNRWEDTPEAADFTNE
jgi:hypothetical protein